MPNMPKLPLVVLVATLPGREQLLYRAIQSVARQDRQPDKLLIVSDQMPLSALIRDRLLQLQVLGETHFLVNTDASGAANTWNTGIRSLRNDPLDCYLAILDDDDEWDADHLATCTQVAQASGNPDVVVSGLRLLKDGVHVPQSTPTHFTIDDFLAGNPGWQGSNTFLRKHALQRAGCFTPGLQSCNDRDMAIRVLSLPSVQIAYTGRNTASWHLDSNRKSLSSHRNQSKLEGLAQFFHLHGHRMDKTIQRKFFRRAKKLFGWSQQEILNFLRTRKSA